MELGLHVFLFLVVTCVDRTACLGQDTDGHDDEYVFTIPKLLQSNPPRVMITTTSEDPVVATLSIPGYVLPIHTAITRNKGADIELPSDIKMNFGDGKQHKTVIVRASEGAVSVYAIDNEFGGGDVFQCIPSSQLGTKYSVASYKPYSTAYPSFVSVSALHSPTTVTISNAKEIIHSVTLHQYESYRFDVDYNEDLSGLLVQGTKAIAVITGSFSYIPNIDVCCADGFLAQLSPTDSWGTEYFLFPFQSLNAGFVYRVSSFNVSTTLFMSNGTIIEILPGHFYEGDVSGDTVVYLEANQPVMVAQYMKGYYGNNPSRGDPSMLIVPPASSYYNHLTFPVFEYIMSTGHTYYINVVTQCDNIEGIIFDEATSVASWDKLTTYNQTMCCVRNEISTGYHSVTHTNPNAIFFVSVYAISNGSTSSYAYAASGIYELAQRPKSRLTTETPNTKQSTSFANRRTPILTTEVISRQTDLPAAEGCFKFKSPVNGLLEPDEDIYKFGQVVTVYCRQGFDLIGDESLFCTYIGDWHGIIPSCSKRNSGCPKLTRPFGGLLEPDKDVYETGQFVTVNCRQGFDLVGDERLFCTDTGDWQGEIPTCMLRNSETASGNVIMISASAGGFVLITVVLIVTICYCRKRCKTSRDNLRYYSSNLPGRLQTPAPKDEIKLANPNIDSRVADNKGYETPQDNAAYQDLELSTMASTEQEYNGLYALAT